MTTIADEHEDLAARHPLPPLLSVVPGQNERHEEARGEQHLKRSQERVGDAPWLAELGDHAEARGGRRRVRHAPLDELALLELLEGSGHG